MLIITPHKHHKSIVTVDQRPIYWITGTITCPVCSESWSSIENMRMDCILPDCLMIQEDYEDKETGRTRHFKSIWIMAPDLNMLCSDKCLDLYLTFPVLYDHHT